VIEQFRILISRVPTDFATPLFVGDADAAASCAPWGRAKLLVLALARLRADHCFSADSPLAVPSPHGGRPRTHEATFAGKDLAP
jgi:hypothetical protein